jgi:putative acyl-CoA dehydrogenase
MPSTHEVTNQPPPLVGYDVFTADAALVDGVARHAPDLPSAQLAQLGRLAGSEQAQDLDRLANTSEPVLHTHDRFGHRIDEVEFSLAWHELMRRAVGYGIHALPWRADRPGGHVTRSAAFFVWSQAEWGHLCPISMTCAAVPTLGAEPNLAAEWVPRLTSYDYDFGLRPPASKAGCLAGMGMTEKQGGSDVRANSTRAEPLAAGGEYLLTGHKWFCSAPMSDVFLVLAQAPGGLTCFLLPRVLDDGTRNVFRLQRLKDKLGNRSNASAEVEFETTWARRVGPEGRGVATIIEMVAMTRLDCVTGSASIMRNAVANAAHHVRHRRAFGAYLAEAPLMRNVVADLAIESEAATALTLRLAAAVDAGEAEAPWRRLGLAAGKYWVCKRAPNVAAESLECLGGNGYIEDSGLPRIYREAPLNSIWEGSGNVNALDVLRAMARTPEAVESFVAELALAAGADRRLDAAVAELRETLADPADAELRARRVVERMALALQGSLLARHAPPYVADAFCASRLGGDGGLAFGTLPRGADVGAILERATPKLG